MDSTNLRGQRILVTGVAGFIGFHLTEYLLKNGCFVVGVDNINDYYDINLKYARLNELGIKRDDAELFYHWCESVTYSGGFLFKRLNLEDKSELEDVFKEMQFDIVCNLAAQAGVRYSIENPDVYIQNNIVGFFNILECCRNSKIKHLLYASSSSVYGANTKIPFLVSDRTDTPISLYAATKKSNELMAYTYSHLYGIPTTGLRFFTVYGPWGRPDMAIYLFAEAIASGKPIKVFNYGNMKRDFTYIDDIIDGIGILLKNTPVKKNVEPAYRLSNIGNGSPEFLEDFIKSIEDSLGIKAVKDYLPMQPGDVSSTWAEVKDIEELGYCSKTEITVGVKKFIDWFKVYRG